MSAALAEIPAAPALSFGRPLPTLAAWIALTERRRTEVSFDLDLLKRIHGLITAGHSLHAASRAVAAACGHLRRGLSAPTLRRKYTAYTAGGYHPNDRAQAGECFAPGDWRILVADYKGPSAQPAAFVQEIKRAAEEQQRSKLEAMRTIRDRWAAGEEIPGYGTWIDWHRRLHPERPLPKVWPRNFFPPGWHPRNMGRYGPSQGARLIVTRGLAAARRHLAPPVQRDPSKLRPLELVVIDDFELDCHCVFRGDAHHKPQVAPVAGLLALDVATRRPLAWGLGPRLMREEKQADGTVRLVKSGVRSSVDVPHLLHQLFARHGLPPWQMTILCENKSAAIEENKTTARESAIKLIFDGRVRIERTGLIDHRTLANGFTERGGKPWEKGWIESAFNSLWNIMGATAGYKGSNERLNGPGDLDDKLRVTKLLLGQGDRQLNLPPEKLALLRTPFLSVEELEKTFVHALALREARTDHRYLGFDEVTEFLLEPGGEPQPFERMALVPIERHTSLEILPPRRESPAERWHRLMQGVACAPVQPAVLALLLLTPKPVTWRSNSVTFTHGRSGYSYVDAAGTVMAGVPEGTEFLAFFDPAAPEQVHLATKAGAFAGTLTRLGGRRGAVDITDEAALKTAAALQQTLINRTLAEVRERHAAADERLRADQLHNAAIVAAHKAETAGLTPVQKIALAAGDGAARAHEQRQAERRAARPVPAHGGPSLDDLAEAAVPADATPHLPAPEPIPARKDDVSLDDL